jgi:hypothetical protein
MAGIPNNWMEARAGCGRKMPRVCKKAYANFWMEIFYIAAMKAPGDRVIYGQKKKEETQAEDS